MKRLQKYIDRQIAMEPLKDDSWLASLNIEPRYVPEALEGFDEMEFGLGQVTGKSAIFTLVVVEGKLKRISLGWIPEDGAEDEMHAFSESELKAVVDEKGNVLSSFFEKMTEA